MKICKKTPLFMLLFTGYLCSHVGTANKTEAPPSPHATSPTASSPTDSKSQTAPEDSVPVPGKRLSTVLAAGISIGFVVLLVLVVAGVWCARKRSMGRSAEMDSVPYGEPQVSLKSIATHENQCEWPLERAAV